VRGKKEPICEAGAVLAVWNDANPQIADEYEQWYQCDHLQDRLRVPGFRAARRYRRMSGRGRKYFTFYVVDSLAVLSSEAYLRRLDEVRDWTRRIMPHFRRLVRSACKVAFDVGDGTGGVIGCLILKGLSADRRGVAREATIARLGALLQDGRLTRGRVWEGDAEVTGVASRERAMRPEPDVMAEMVVVLEGTDEVAVQAGMNSLESLTEFVGANRIVPTSLYRLLFASPD